MATSRWRPKAEWIDEVTATIKEKRSANWFVRTDTGKELNMQVEDGRLIHLSCGFADVRGTMARIAKAQVCAIGRGEPPKAGRRTIAEESQIIGWLDTARRSGEIAEGPSERLAYGATPSRPAPARAFQPAARAEPAAPAHARQMPSASTAPTPRRRPLLWLRRTIIVATAASAAAWGVIEVTGLDVRPMINDIELPSVDIGFGTRTVASDIRSAERWREGERIALEGRVRLLGDASLIIEPGVEVRAGPGAELIVGRDARIDARGHRERPIVFTSSAPDGERSAGDWRGLTLLGNAPIDAEAQQLRAEQRARGHEGAGGRDSADSCGTLEYVRIEFAGASDATAALVLEGCGDRTHVRRVQVHRALAPALALRGGTAPLSQIVLSSSASGALVADRGWNGTAQAVIAHAVRTSAAVPVRLGQGRSEADGPVRVGPTLWNLSVLRARGSESAAIRITTSAPVTLMNVLAAGTGSAIIDASAASTEALAKGRQQIRHVVAAAARTTPETGRANPRTAAVLAQWAHHHANAVVRASVEVVNLESLEGTAPEWAPYEATPSKEGAKPPPGLDEGASYAGAVRPGSQSDWTWGWTAYPQR